MTHALGDRQRQPPPHPRSLFVFFSQDLASSRIHVMDLMAYRTGHRLIDVAVLRSILGRETLNT